MEKKGLKRESLPLFFAKLQDGPRKVYAPKRFGDQVRFEAVSRWDEVDRQYIQTSQAAKFALFPKAEELFSYRQTHEGTAIQDRDLSMLPDLVLFGVRPCDAASISALNAIFTWDYQDTLFKTRSSKTTLVAFSCGKADEYCFCTSVGGGPGSTKGSDLLLTQVSDEEWLVEILTEKGQALVQEMSDLFGKEPTAVKEDHLAKVDPRFEVGALTASLEKAFDEEGVWQEQSLRCLGCGACAFVCPTCACFDIQDEGTRESGRRIRCWDSCGFSAFTIHTSGHNPREHQSHRWRQRILHKFSYMPQRLDVLGCVGCGRCSRSCPVDMNLLESLVSLAKVQQE